MLFRSIDSNAEWAACTGSCPLLVRTKKHTSVLSPSSCSCSPPSTSNSAAAASCSSTSASWSSLASPSNGSWSCSFIRFIVIVVFLVFGSRSSHFSPTFTASFCRFPTWRRSCRLVVWGLLPLLLLPLLLLRCRNGTRKYCITSAKGDRVSLFESNLLLLLSCISVASLLPSPPPPLILLNCLSSNDKCVRHISWLYCLYTCSTSPPLVDSGRIYGKKYALPVPAVSILSIEVPAAEEEDEDNNCCCCCCCCDCAAAEEYMELPGAFCRKVVISNEFRLRTKPKEASTATTMSPLL
mmetsp:Transcript_24401/g.40619  ORF Transcript_24401/g.40619 Transcript_24401/m.40619 type:complete len:296 (-) Transcript_24401:1610-2497(-)